MKSLQNKTIIVTGASKGLGVAMAKSCAAAGANVVLAARDLRRLQEHERAIRASGGSAISVRCDISKLGDLRRLVVQTVKKFRAIHGVINNAGVDFVKPFLQIDENDWDHVIDVDLKGTFFLTQYCATQMLKQSPKGGSIVQIASVHTLASVSGAAPYDAAKHGIVGFSKAAAIELASDNIRVNIVSPGLCRTEIWKALLASAPDEKECIDYWNANIPAERLIEPQEIADICVFLLGDASSSITGSNIVADLGMTSQLVSKRPFQTSVIAAKPSRSRRSSK
jgi:NAD(P)-dependent dehydrogenase (short-subunit alcohol dehydrogenase family)